MDAPFDIEVLRRKLSAIMDKKEVKPTTLSLQVGSNPSLVKDLLEKTADTKLSTVYKLADALAVSVFDLLDDEVEIAPVGPRLFLKGEVAAGQWVEAYEWHVDDWRVMTGRPDSNADPAHRFFLRVKGDSMDQLYPDGTYLECASVFGHAEPSPGKRVIAVRMREDQLLEATVKELVERDGQYWLVPKSNNPMHQAYRIDEPGEGIEEVKIVAVVIASMRPE